MQGTYWDKKDAASVFEDSGLSAIALMEMLDRKLMKLSCSMNDPFVDTRFRRWMKNERENFVAFFFLTTELMGKDHSPLEIYVVCDYFRMNSVADGLNVAKLNVFQINLTDYNQLMQEGSVIDGSATRALLSSELLIAGRSARELETAIGFAKKIQETFENEKLSEDLGFLIAVDISRNIRKSTEGNIEIASDEMRRNAIKMMKKRRVEPHIQKKIMPAIKKALTM